MVPHVVSTRATVALTVCVYVISESCIVYRHVEERNLNPQIELCFRSVVASKGMIVGLVHCTGQHICLKSILAPIGYYGY